MKQKDTTFLIIAIVISLIMFYSLIQSFLYEIGSIESTFWSFIYITSLFILGSLAFIPLIIKLTHKFKKADTLSSSEKDFKTIKTIIRRKFKYVIVIFLYIGFFIAVGTIISERAISTFLGPDLFPSDVYAFLLITGLIMIFSLLGVLTAIDFKKTQREK